MTLVCPLFYLGPSAIHVKKAEEFGIAPTSVEGKEWFEAASKGDLTEAGRIGLQRTLTEFPGLTPMDSNPANEKRPLKSIVSGACLEPYVNDGDACESEIKAPEPYQLVVFHVKGHPPSHQSLKIFLMSVERGNYVDPNFGDNPPERIHIVAQTNPLAICVIAECDVDLWQRVPLVIRGDKSRWDVEHYPVTQEQWEAFSLALVRPVN